MLSVNTTMSRAMPPETFTTRPQLDVAKGRRSSSANSDFVAAPVAMKSSRNAKTLTMIGCIRAAVRIDEHCVG